MNPNYKKDFQEALASLVEFATVSGNHISTGTVKEYFQEIITEDAQYALIYDYLNNAKIIIDDLEQAHGKNPVPENAASEKSVNAETTAKSKNNADLKQNEESENNTGSEKSGLKPVKESQQALVFYEMYLDELQNLNPLTNEERKALYNDLLSGSKAALDSLANACLPAVRQWAEQFEGNGLSRNDLIAEGNLALYEYLLSCQEHPDNAGTQECFEKELKQNVTARIRQAINEELGSNRISDHLTDRVNALNDASTALAKEFGREPTLQELCDRLSLGEEEVKELMKVSINALSVIQTEE